MDFGKIGKNIVMVFGVLALVMGGIVSLYMIAYVGTIILGSVFQTAASGDLPITTGANTTLTTLQTGFNTAVTSVNSGSTFATSLIPVAVILLIFAGVVVIGYLGYKKFKGGSGGY